MWTLARELASNFTADSFTTANQNVETPKSFEIFVEQNKIPNNGITVYYEIFDATGNVVNPGTATVTLQLFEVRSPKGTNRKNIVQTGAAQTAIAPYQNVYFQNVWGNNLVLKVSAPANLPASTTLKFYAKAY